AARRGPAAGGSALDSPPAMRISELPRRYTLWVGFAAVLAPLLVLLGLQYRWLVKLDQGSKKIHTATLNTFVEGVLSDVDHTYREAERFLDLSPDVFTKHDLEKAAHYFKKKGPTGAKRLFVVSFVGKEDKESDALYFQPSCSSFSPPKYSS